MLAILNSLNAYNLPIFQQILIILVSKFMVHRAPSDKIYLLLGLLSPLIGSCIVSSLTITVPPLRKIKNNFFISLFLTLPQHNLNY